MFTNTWLLAICLTLALAVAGIITGCDHGATDAVSPPDDLPDFAPTTCTPGESCDAGGDIDAGGVEIEPIPTMPEGMEIKTIRVETETSEFYARDLKSGRTMRMNLPVGVIITVPMIPKPDAPPADIEAIEPPSTGLDA